MKIRSIVLATLIVGCLAAFLVAQEAALTNNDVIKMTKAGLSAETVIAKIQSSECAFDTRTDALINLASEKVPESVIRVMMNTKCQPATTPPANSPAPPAPTSSGGSQIIGSGIIRTKGICSAKGDLLITDDALQFVPYPGETLCEGKMFPNWDFAVRWDELRLICFEYVVAGTIVIESRDGKDYSIKERIQKIQEIEAKLKTARPKAPYYCD